MVKVCFHIAQYPVCWTTQRLNGQFHEERDKVKIKKYGFFHCKLIALTQTVLHVLGKNVFNTICKFIFMIFCQFSTMRQKKVKFFNFETNDQMPYAD